MATIVALIIAFGFIFGIVAFVWMVIDGEAKAKAYLNSNPRILSDDGKISQFQIELAAILAIYDNPLLMRVPKSVEDWFYISEDVIESNLHFWKVMNNMKKVPEMKDFRHISSLASGRRQHSFADRETLNDYRKLDGCYLKFNNEKDAMYFKMAMNNND